jgi:hypothetical protein
VQGKCRVAILGELIARRRSCSGGAGDGGHDYSPVASACDWRLAAISLLLSLLNLLHLTLAATPAATRGAASQRPLSLLQYSVSPFSACYYCLKVVHAAGPSCYSVLLPAPSSIRLCAAINRPLAVTHQGH